MKTSSEKLLEAGLEVFAEHGFRGTTTRMLAKKAGVNIAGIGYYYGGKEELYKAVVTYIVDSYLSLTEPLLDYVNLNIDNADAKQATSILLKFLTGVTSSSQSPKLSKFALIAVKEQNNPTDAFKIIFVRFTSVMFSTITKCLKKITPEKTDQYYTILSQSLMAQSLLFLAHKANLMNALSVSKFNEHHFETHKQILEHIIKSL